MQVTTYGQTAAPIEVVKPILVSDPGAPNNPSAPSNPTTPVPPPVNPGTPTVPPSPTTVLPSTLTPGLLDIIKPKTPSVFQGIHFNAKRNEYYITQNGKGSSGLSHTPPESTYVSRLDKDGKYLDQMKIIDAGHGTGLVVENYGTKNIVYIWLPIVNQNTDYYRFIYKPGTYAFKDLLSKTKIKKFTSGYATYHADWEADMLLERRTNADSTIKMIKRKITDVVKGIDQPYATLTTEPVRTQQGWASINDSVYVLQGALNGETANPPDVSLLDTYNWSTGTRVDRVNLQLLGQEGGHWQQDTHEPEGLGVYRDLTTKKAHLLIGVTTGIAISGTSVHKYFVYRYANIGNAP